MCSRGVRLLTALAKEVKGRGRSDGTVYGRARTSTRSFFVYHLSAIASAVMQAEALTIANAAATLAFVSTRAPLGGAAAP